MLSGREQELAGRLREAASQVILHDTFDDGDDYDDDDHHIDHDQTSDPNHCSNTLNAKE